MAASIGFYFVLWRLTCTRSAYGFGASFSTLNTGKCPLMTFWLVETNRRCDQVRSKTRDTLWGNGEWKVWMMSPSSPNVLSYLSSQVENVTIEVVTSGKSKFQTVEKYLNSLNRTACSTVQYISIEGRYVTVINRDIRMYCGRFVGPSHTAHGWSPCFIRIIHARIQNWTVCYNGTHTHTLAQNCLFELRCGMHRACTKHFHYTCQEREFGTPEVEGGRPQSLYPRGNKYTDMKLQNHSLELRQQWRMKSKLVTLLHPQA